MALAPDPTEPRHATELIGHETAEKQFLDAWNSGRLAHAWLIAGPRGIGKATFAYRIARFILAGGGGDSGGLFGGGGPESLVVSGDHPAVRRIAANGHPDLRVLERNWSADGKKRQSEIPVDEVRRIGGFLALTPAEGGWRVVIIDAADELNRSGANAILKLLEEPPRNALILMISHSPDRLLPTIRSRCRRLMLRPLAEDVVVTLLRRRLPEMSEADALGVARIAEGSIGRALDLVEGEGLSLYRSMIELLGGLPRMDVNALHSFADKVGGDEEKSRTVENLFLRWLAVTAGRGNAASEVVAGEAALGQRLLASAGKDRWLELWDKAVHGFERAEAVNLDRKQVLLNTFLSLERAIRPS
ncbi:MAG TPA: DNA polymerase III subunit delta' [Magnetospirillaceae bacterium]|jgi:DNA polymerase-3 subunit delta'